MNRSQPHREQLDACRSGSDDLLLPELASLASGVARDEALAGELDRTLKADREIRSQLDEVAVPAGLADRLLASLAAARQQAVASAEVSDSPAPQLLKTLADTIAAELESEAAPTVVAAPEAASADAKLVSRRRWLQVSLGTALAASLAGGLGVWLRMRSTTAGVVSRDELASQVEKWIDKVAPPAGWKTADGTMPRTKYVIDPAVQGRPRRWQLFAPRGATTGDGVVYDLTPPGRQRVLLFVIRTNVEHDVVTIASPKSTLPASRGIKLAAWQSRGLLSVLAVDEDGQRLEDFLISRPIT